MTAPFSTRNGEYAFVVEFADGTRATELECFWDDVPLKPISALLLIHARAQHEIVRLTEFEKFFFYNKGFAVLSDGGPRPEMHSAKAIGGVRSDGTVVEAVLEFRGGRFPKCEQASYPFEMFAHQKSILRPGVAVRAA